MNEISWQDFEQVELRAGTIVEAMHFPEARKPAYKVRIDFGESLGIKQSSAQITHHYTPEQLVGRQVLCVTNFPPKQIGPWISEVLVTGCADDEGHIILAAFDREVPNGARLH